MKRPTRLYTGFYSLTNNWASNSKNGTRRTKDVEDGQRGVRATERKKRLGPKRKLYDTPRGTRRLAGEDNLVFTE
jgi:hypothetical protein